MPINIQILSDSALSITEQIRQQVEVAIASGALVPGENLPSIRQLAVQLKVNPNTVAKSFQHLVTQGTLHSQKGKGYSVSSTTTTFSELEISKRLNIAAKQFVADTRPLGLTRTTLIQAIDSLLPEEKDSE